MLIFYQEIDEDATLTQLAQAWFNIGVVRWKMQKYFNLYMIETW